MTANSTAQARWRGPGARNGLLRRALDSEQFTGWAFVTPGVAIILLFGAVPIIWSAVMSFQRNNLLSPSTPFVGTANYRKMIHDPVVAQAIERFSHEYQRPDGVYLSVDDIDGVRTRSTTGAWAPMTSI